VNAFNSVGRKFFNKYGYLLLLLPLLALVYADSGYAWRVATTALIFSLLAASANLLTGVSGLMSLGHGAIYGLGAYASALLCTQLGLPVWLALPLAGHLADAATGEYLFCRRDAWHRRNYLYRAA
jgi:branched-chain amino acid transport system permease protein